MRGEERNNSLLRSMRIHIAEWEAGRATPEGSRFMFIWLAMYLGTAWPALAYCQPLLALGFLVIWFFPSQWICRRIVPRYNESWAEVFDRKLSDYEPLNLPAWEHLKHQAETEGLTVSIVSNWYQEEVRTVWPEKKPDLKFLHKVTDGNEKIGEE